MSTDAGEKGVASAVLDQSKALLARAEKREQQLSLLDPVTPEELAEAREALGPAAGGLVVVREARERRRGRKPGSKNRRSDDFARWIGQFGQDPAITLMQIQGTTEEVLVERSRRIVEKLTGKGHVVKMEQTMTFEAATALRVRCAEALMPYMHSKKPVAVDLSVDGDFNLVIPGLNMTETDARQVGEGTFVLADYSEVEEAEVEE